MDYLALSDFNLVARHGGFGAAARASGRPKPTLSRRVGELEGALGLRLVERGARVLKLTEEGRALYERTAGLMTEIDEVVANIASRGSQPRGRLRISAPLLISQTAMGKIAAGFALRHPEVQLEVTTEDRAVNLVEEGYDLVIRVNPDPDETLVGRIFLRDRLVVVASRDFASPGAELPAPAVVRGLGKQATSWEVTTSTGRSSIAIRPILRLSSLVMVCDAVRAGAGIAQLPISLVSHELAAGTLQSWGDVPGPDIALWVLYPSRRLLSARASAFVAYLKEAFPSGSPEELAAYLAS